jgi:hypothetical protein
MSLIQIVENNIFAIGRYWGNLNSSISGDNGIYSMKTGIEVADLNWTWNEKPLVEKDTKIINQLKKNYNDLNLPFWWWVYPCGQSEKTIKILMNEGFNYRETIPCMALDVNSIPLKIHKSDDLEISFVSNERELQIWESVSFAGFEMPQKTKSQFHEFVKSFDVSKNSAQKLFLAYWQGEPVATALLFLQSNAVGIYFVTTLESYKNRGVALALVFASMKYAKSSGYKYCVLQSSKEGLNVYLRAGFKEYCRADVYCLPD